MAKYHIDNWDESKQMKSSAVFDYEMACKIMFPLWQNDKKSIDDDAAYYALKSLSYSVGKGHKDYQTAERIYFDLSALETLTAIAKKLKAQYDIVLLADPNNTQGDTVLAETIKSLEQAKKGMSEYQPTLKALISHTAQSTDLSMVKERMETLYTEFIQHYAV